MTNPTLALDLGGARMRGALVQADGTVTARVSEPTPGDQTCAHALRQLMQSVAADAGKGGFDSVVVGVPGRVDYVVGGGLGRIIDLLGSRIRAALERYGPRGLAAPIVVTQAAPGDDSGLVGAAGWNAATGLSR